MTCPTCGNQDGELSVAGQYWGYCERHKVRWWTRTEPNRVNVPDTWIQNRRFLSAFRDTTPPLQVML